MAIKIRRGLNADRLLVVFDEGEIVYTTDTKNVYIGDGVTAGGNPVGSVTYASIVAALGYVPADDSITVKTTGTYSNPSWLTSLAWSKISSTPTTLSGYGITDAVPSSRTLTINGVTYDLSANRTWTISTATPTLDQVTTAGNTTTNSISVGTITGDAGISQFKFNTGAGGVTPTIAVGNTATSGKFAALLAGTVGAEFNFDNSGWFAIAGDSKSNYTSNNLGSGSETYYFRIQGGTGNVQIGTTTDAGYKLDVNGTIRGTAVSIVGGTSSQFLKADGSVDSSTYYQLPGGGTVSDYIDGTGVIQPFPTLLSADKMVTVGRNSTGSTLYRGTVVYISGSTGNLPNFVKAQANSEATSAGTFGVVLNDIANNADGQVVTIGSVSNLDTRSTAPHPFTDVTLNDGDTVYLHPTIAGYITNVKPYAPYHLVYVGKVTRTSPTNGTIVYRIQNGYELDELHNVAAQTPSNNDGLFYETSTSLWKNKSIATVLGYTPADTSLVVPSSRTLTINGTTYDLSANRTWTISTATPTLDAVTTAGNTTTNSISVGGLTVATNLIYTDTVNSRVGIGTTSPQYKLDIQGNTNADFGFQVLNSSAGTSARTFFQVVNNVGTYAELLMTSTAYAGPARFGQTGPASYLDTNNKFLIGTIGVNDLILGTSNTERIRLFGSTGNLAIGTTTDAGYKLDVNGTARVQGNLSIIQSGIYFDSSADSFISGRNSSSSESTKIIVRSQSHGGIEIGTKFSSGRIVFQTGNGVYNERMRIDQNGLIGIGTTSAVANFQVSGSITASSSLAQGVYFNNTLVAAANNDVLVGLDINPTFTNGAFTGVSNIGVRVQKGTLRLASISADPTTAANGDMYYNTTLNLFRVFQGGAWKSITAI